MKTSQFTLLVANIWIVASFMANNYDRIFMVVIGIILFFASLVMDGQEKKKENKKIIIQKKLDGSDKHTKRFYIEDGKVVDREATTVEGFKPVKKE